MRRSQRKSNAIAMAQLAELKRLREDKPVKRTWVETVGDKRVIHVDTSEAMRSMEAKIAKMTPEEIARNQAESDRLEAEFNAEQDD